MKIMKRIMLSSALLVLLSLLILAVIMAGVILIPPAIQGNYEAKQVMDENIFSVGKVLEDYNTLSGDWESLHNELLRYGFALFVIDDNGRTQFAGTDLHSDSIAALKDSTFPEIVQIGTISKKTFVAVKLDQYLLFALKDIPPIASSAFGNLIFLILLTTIGIAIIFYFSQFFTRKMAWRIVSPLNTLAEGAKRIKDGDLSQPIIYEGTDEFTDVCMAFNHMQKSLADEREKIAAYERARTEMIAGISHDLRTPLTSVKGYIKGLRDGVAKTPEKTEQYLSIAYQKTCDIDVLLQKLFDLSKLETGNLPISLEEWDLGHFIKLFAAEEQFILEEKNVKLSVAISENQCPVRIDPAQMKRVLLNLTDNSIKYNGMSALTITISVQREEDSVYLYFQDNGVGIEESKLPHLFDRFWRGDEARAIKNGESSGLGLYIVKYIIEAHGGNVSAKNDGGFIIKIALPCRKGEVI